MDAREQRGLTIAATKRIKPRPDGRWLVPSSESNETKYVVDPAGNNFAAIERVGASAFIPFKSNSTEGQDGTIWRRLFHFFQFERDAFLAHYHKRSNVETVFSMVKAKFGNSVRSKTDTAQKNEILLKLLCHNLCCLVQAIYERKLEPVFWPEKAPEAARIGVAS
jgi:hypothetical protein